jgi:undecaprenyl-diphosphatase
VADRLQGQAAIWLWLATVIAFVALAVRAASGHVLAIDASLADAIQDLPRSFGRLFSFENWLGDTVPLACLTVLIALLFLARGRKLEALLIVLTFLPRLADVLIKNAVKEPRPSADIIRVAFPHDNLSFPSGHVIGVTLVFGLLAILAPRLAGGRRSTAVVQVMSLFLIATIGLARVWVGAHWPSDVLAGYLYALIFLIPAVVCLRLFAPTAP